MIEQVQLKYFKQFKGESFILKDSVVLAGPNNAGKTTLLQAIATWYFAYREWEKKRVSSSAGRRSGVPLTRKEFLSVPVQRFNLLWTAASTALRRDEGGGKGAATPRIMQITLKGGSDTENPWAHTMEFRYANSELIYAKPTDSSVINEKIQVVYVPSFSGIETEEKVHTPEYQDWLIGQGKPGDIIRNLLAETSSRKEAWQSLLREIETLFSYRLLEPQYEGRPFILCEYLPGIPPGTGYGGFPKLDIASAGSGFLQTLLLLSFFHARPSTVLLVDEPDAHLHVVLQKQVYDRLRTVAGERKCQVIVATHSEVVIDNTSPEKIISFYKKPHLLMNKAQRNQVREALRKITSMDILLSKRGKILYGEDNSDFSILRAWAYILEHPLKAWFADPHYSPIKGNNPKRARSHFFALREVNPEISGVLILDGDNRDMPEREVLTDGLKIIRWRRYEIENYIVHPASIKRFFDKKKLPPLFFSAGEREMENILPPVVMQSPLDDHEYLRNTKASANILPRIFSAAQIDITKQEYHEIAEVMTPDEIHPEVKKHLDSIAAHWGIE